MDNGGCFKKYKIGDLFYVKGNPQLNKESFTFSENREYPYFTRTVFNNGIYDYVDYLDQEHLIKGNSLAVGMMACKFFYMEHDFYAGQFTKTCYPRFSKFNEKIATYFISLLNCYSDKLKGVLVRDFESTFNSIVVDLPLFSNQISFDYMESYIRELEQERIRELDAYLKATGLNDYELTPEEKNSIEIMSKGGLNYKEFKVLDIFTVKNTQSVMKSQVDFCSGDIPYVTAGETNNSIASYISAEPSIIDKGNCIVIGGKSTVVTYQEQDFVSNDSHNLALYMKETDKKSKYTQMFFVTLLSFKLKQLYNWGNSISNKKIQKDTIHVPVNQNGDIDYQFIELYSKAVEKLCIKSVVDWKDRIIQTTKNVVNC